MQLCRMQPSLCEAVTLLRKLLIITVAILITATAVASRFPKTERTSQGGSTNTEQPQSETSDRAAVFLQVVRFQLATEPTTCPLSVNANFALQSGQAAAVVFGALHSLCLGVAYQMICAFCHVTCSRQRHHSRDRAQLCATELWTCADLCDHGATFTLV